VAAAVPTTGLRERKKEKTRAAIKKHALRLFRRRGYANTTVEDIAAAAEISPSTFFRYFPTKESVLLDEQYPREFVAEFDAQPHNDSPVRAMRRAVLEEFERMSEEELASLRGRNILILSTPELRAAYMEHIYKLMTLIAESAAKRVNREPSALEVRTFAWVMQGVLTAAAAYWTETEGTSLADALDKAFDHLEAGLPL
jgi:AcrR family transcriptional regulator